MTMPNPKEGIHCPRLGHSVTLSYCVRESIDLPCKQVFRCWVDRIPIRDYLLTLYSPSQLEALQPPASKLASIVDLIKQAQKSIPPGPEFPG